MKAIVTKYHGPIPTRGARISARDEDGNRVVIPLDGGLRDEEEHTRAAVALCERMNWPGTLMRGGLGNRYVFVFVDLNDAVVLHGTQQNYKIVRS